MRTSVAGAFVLLLSAAPLAAEPLEGWAELKFGMTVDEAMEATGGDARPEINIVGKTILKFARTVASRSARVIVGFENGRLNIIVLQIDKGRVRGLQECLDEADEIAGQIEQRYGATPRLRPWGSGHGRDTVFDLEGGSIEVQFGILDYKGYPDCNGAVVYKGATKKMNEFQKNRRSSSV